MKRVLLYSMGLSTAVSLFAAGAFAAPAGDTEAKKTAKSAMEKDYMAGDFELALQKLKLADSLCETRGCTGAVRAQIYASQAIIHWVGKEDKDTAAEEMKSAVKSEPKYRLTDEYASPDMIAKFDAVKREVTAPPPPPPPPPAKSAAAPAPPAAPAAPERDPQQEEFRRSVESRKTQYAREAEEAQRA
ncbi:MAG TPA: hypothetical protein VGL13_12255, partial [Polyangiaceae bacterium]